MFVDKEKTIDIVIYYNKQGRFYDCHSKRSFDDLEISEDEKSSYKKVSIRMRELSWGLYNDIQEDSVIVDQNGNRNFNYRLYKENRLVKLIHSWDAKTTNGNGEVIPVPVTEENIKSLAPEIAELISSLYDDSSYFTEEDEKK